MYCYSFLPRELFIPQQGKWKEARDLLAEVYAWLTEGFDTADLQETKALLEELASRRRHVPARARRTLTAAGGRTVSSLIGLSPA